MQIVISHQPLMIVPLLICHTNKANFTDISGTGAESILCNRSDSGVDLENAMEQLAQYGLTRSLM